MPNLPTFPEQVMQLFHFAYELYGNGFLLCGVLVPERYFFRKQLGPQPWAVAFIRTVEDAQRYLSIKRAMVNDNPNRFKTGRTEWRILASLRLVRPRIDSTHDLETRTAGSRQGLIVPPRKEWERVIPSKFDRPPDKVMRGEAEPHLRPKRYCYHHHGRYMPRTYPYQLELREPYFVLINEKWHPPRPLLGYTRSQLEGSQAPSISGSSTTGEEAVASAAVSASPSVVPRMFGFPPPRPQLRYTRVVEFSGPGSVVSSVTYPDFGVEYLEDVSFATQPDNPFEDSQQGVPDSVLSLAIDVVEQPRSLPGIDVDSPCVAEDMDDIPVPSFIFF